MYLALGITYFYSNTKIYIKLFLSNYSGILIFNTAESFHIAPPFSPSNHI